jgi:hypothetical protein
VAEYEASLKERLEAPPTDEHAKSIAEMVRRGDEMATHGWPLFGPAMDEDHDF